MSNDQSDKIVEISLDGTGKPVPDQDPIQVWRGSQKIKWRAPFEFQIAITGYDQIEYSRGGQGNSDYQCKTGYFEGKSYKYTISANGVDNDPMIDVKP